MKGRKLAVATILLVTQSAFAHDIWIEADTSLVHLGNWVSLSLMLGNHGNHHRDFRRASKVSAGDQSLWVVGPDGTRFDLARDLVDTWEFWQTKYRPSTPGLYMAVSTFDKVMSYGPVRDIKCAKTFFAVPGSPQRMGNTSGLGRAVGSPLELVIVGNPPFPLRAGTSLRVKVLFQGKPLPKARVSFIPRGTELQGDFDPHYEKWTDGAGIAQITIEGASPYLIVSHLQDTNAMGNGYSYAGYSASIFCGMTSEMVGKKKQSH